MWSSSQVNIFVLVCSHTLAYTPTNTSLCWTENNPFPVIRSLVSVLIVFWLFNLLHIPSSLQSTAWMARVEKNRAKSNKNPFFSAQGLSLTIREKDDVFLGCSLKSAFYPPPWPPLPHPKRFLVFFWAFPCMEKDIYSGGLKQTQEAAWQSCLFGDSLVWAVAVAAGSVV